jgi:hypothetical protein
LPDATTRAIAWLTAWDAQGLHRTATAGDQAGADWLIGEAAGIGAAPEVEKFALDRLDPIGAYLKFSGVRIPGAPVFDAPATVPMVSEPDIAVVELWPRSVYTPDYEKKAASPRRALRPRHRLPRRTAWPWAAECRGVPLFLRRARSSCFE